MPKAKKSLGQNFLIDPAVTNQILQFINPDSKDIFLEIGPGKGAITKQLASRVDTTHAVEIDEELSYKLTELEDKKNFYVHNKSILDFDPTKIFTNKSNNFVQWWAKTTQQAADSKLEPVLFFKANHAQFFVSTIRKPKQLDYMYISWLGAYICLAEKWLEKETQEWTDGERIYEPWSKADS